VVDISNPLLPYVAGQCSLSRAYDVEVSGSYAYVVSEELFTVVDITDPSNPSFITCVGGLNVPSDICVSGMYAFVTDRYDLHLVDITDPHNPQEIYWTGESQSSGIDISGLYAYISKPDGISVYNISQPANPISAGYYNSWGSGFRFHGVYASGTYAYASTNCGLKIYQFYGAGIEETEEKTTSPLSFKLLQNPVRDNHISVQLQNWKDENINLSLYNLLGQRIKIFHLNKLPSGENKIRLQIQELQSGIYFLKLEGQATSQSAKLTVLR